MTRPEASRRSAGSRAAEGYSDTLELANLDVTTKTTAHNPITLGDPVPWFTASLIAGGSFILHVHAGRWIVLCFFGSPNNPRVNEELAELLQEASLFDEDRLIVRAVFTTPPDDVAKYPEVGTKALSFLADYDGAITRSFGALDRPRTMVLDPMLRVVADIPWDFAQGHAATVRGILRSLPAIDDSAGVPMHAPALIVPRVLNFELCEFLVRLYEQQGGEDSGFLVDLGSKTKTVVDYRLKRRSDLAVVVPELRELIGGQIVRRLLPAVERYFQFQATRMDRYIVACYDSEIGGHFYRHRDNVDAGAQHRRLSRSTSIATMTAATWCFRSSAGRPIGRRMAAPWCFHAARFIKWRPSRAGGVTPFWHSSTRKPTPQGAKPITPGCTTVRRFIPGPGIA